MVFARPVALHSDILFFELFPAFVMIVAAIVGVALYVANRSDEP